MKKSVSERLGHTFLGVQINSLRSTNLSFMYDLYVQNG